MDEVWKDIVGYEDYQVSNYGRVKTKKRLVRYIHSVTRNEHFRETEDKFLKIYLNNRTGYKFVQLYRDKKSKNLTIHRLVANTFLERNEFDYVNHLDGNKHNNFVQNLEWCSNDYNHEHATKTGLKAKGERVSSSKLTEREVYAIKYLLANKIPHTIISKAFNVSRPTISLINEGKTWKHVSLTGKELEVNIWQS
ncbi:MULTISPECIES: NUMOD4 domain-containing protein [Sphingobacterium]|uniref:NUMOD4 domain-containing protein n=1 Tax=Sphingobacterium TaxID=28453 RepID=UPI00257F36B5|nr:MULTISPECIES: NUMOD4 domain-containing protein [Sphingobacterium]